MMGEESSFLQPSTAGITLQQPDDGGVAFRSFNKLLKGQFTCERKTSINGFVYSFQLIKDDTKYV